MLSFFIARSHLLSRKSHTVVNIISAVSVLAVAVPVMAMVVILSFHNGLSSFIEQMYSKFDSELRIAAIDSRDFDATPQLMQDISAVDGVGLTSLALEQNVLLTYNDRQWIATLRGVDSMYRHVVPIEEQIVQGQYLLDRGDLPQGIIGQGIAYSLGVNPVLLDPITIYAIRPGNGGRTSFLPMGLYTTANIQPGAIYALDQQTDSRYMLASIAFTRSLLESSPNRVSSIEIRLAPRADVSKVKAGLALSLGSGFKIETRLEQKGTIYRMVEQEKWVIYLLLLFVVIIAALSLVGSVVMLITDKSRDRQILEAMGADRRLLRRIFTTEGVLITILGVAIGLLLGVAIALGQQQSGLIKMAGEAFLMEAYPVKILLSDIAVIALGVTAIGTLISYATTSSMIRRNSNP